MRASLRRVVLVLTAVSIPVFTAVPARAQDAVRLQLRPTFATPAPVGPRTPRTDMRFATPARDARMTPQARGARDPHLGWDLEFHTGASWSHASSGTTTMPEAGPGFLTFNGFQTRAVRSWYFGDGTAMINAHFASVGLGARITALDSAMVASSVRSSSFSPFGVRVGRSINPRLGAEFAFELMGGLGFTDAASSAAEATRSTFQNAFTSRFAGLTTPAITSTLTLSDGGTQILATGAITINLKKGGRVVPYIVAGGGALISAGTDPTIALLGDYGFVFGASGTPYRQTDTLSVRYAAGSALVGLAGAGFKWYLTDRSGLRADFRAHFAADPVNVVVNWNPETIQGTPRNTLAFSGSPALQISTTNPALSSLSLEQTEPDFQVSTGGIRQMMNFTVGYFYRFPIAPSAPRPSTPAAAGARLWESKRVWEVDVHGGGQLGAQATGGTALGTFPVGQAFTAASGQPSRYASTWMFGDGAVLINQIAAGFTGIPVIDRMSSLNPVLTGTSLERSSRGSFGARVSRRLSSRLRAEFEMESAGTSVAFTQTSLNRIEATRASFAAIWNGLIATGGGIIFTNSSVSATSNFSSPVTNWQTSLTGSLEIRLWQTNRVVTYATGGAGVIRRSALLPEATLTGTYQFLFAGVAPLSETDLVRVHYSVKQYAPVVTFGGGMKYFLTARNGLRADVRVYASGNSLDTLVDAAPSNVQGSPTFNIPSTTNPALVFSNSPAVRGNLTGPAIVSLKTFTGSGQQIQYSITAGYFFRF